MILFGHPTGNPNSHHAALAHLEAGRLEAFCVPWFPSAAELAFLSLVPGARAEVARLKRRHFEPLSSAPKIQGRAAEWRRMAARLTGLGSERLAYEANDWLMRTMAGACRRKSVTAVHAYEDCSLWQFQEAKKRGKACLYDMPIGYYPWWEQQQQALAKTYAAWLPTGGLPSSRFVRPEQKIQEMELADVVLVACSFVERTIKEFYPDKNVALAPYGVDAEFWSPGGAQHGAWSMEHGAGGERLRDQGTKGRRDEGRAGSGERSESRRQEPEAGVSVGRCFGGTVGSGGEQDGSALLLATSDSRPATPPLRFIYAGQSSIRKGTPVLIEAWEKAGLRDAELLLVGSWQLAGDRLKRLPPGVRFVGPVGPEMLRDFYRESDVFVFPSFFEGFGLVILEAMACGLPVIASDRSAAPDVLDDSCGRVIAAGDAGQLAESLRFFASNRGSLGAMKAAARRRAETFSWGNYRQAVRAAVRCATMT